MSGLLVPSSSHSVGAAGLLFLLLVSTRLTTGLSLPPHPWVQEGMGLRPGQSEAHGPSLTAGTASDSGKETPEGKMGRARRGHIPATG